MKTIVSFIIFISCTGMAFCQNQMKVITDKFQRGQYEEVVSIGKKYRNTLAGKGIPALDYMILTSLCMNPAKKEQACKISNLILDDYYQGLDEKYISLMRDGFTKICTQNESPNTDVIAKLGNIQYAHQRPGIAGISSEFKSYSIIFNGFLNQPDYQKISYNAVENIAGNPAISSDSIKTFTNFEIDNLVSKRCKRNDDQAIKNALKRFGGVTKFYVTKNFLIISAENNYIDIKKVGESMEEVLGFYRAYYSFDLPDDLIVINLASSYNDIKTKVEKMYNTNVNFQILGYSNKFDNSITTWVSSFYSVGTIKHELIHILLKSKFDNIPHWFEEGLAELYEESDFKNGMLEGKNNWRLSLLQSNLFNYSLVNLINNSDFTPSQSDKASMKQKAIRYIQMWDNTAYNYESSHINAALDVFFSNYFPLYKDALSRYFIMYLQETKKLKPLFDNLANRDMNLFDIDNYETIDVLIKKSCDKGDLTEVNDDFVKWLAQEKY